MTKGDGDPRQMGQTSSARVDVWSSGMGNAGEFVDGSIDANTPHFPVIDAARRACGLASGRSGGVGESCITIADVDVSPSRPREDADCWAAERGWSK